MIGLASVECQIVSELHFCVWNILLKVHHNEFRDWAPWCYDYLECDDWIGVSRMSNGSWTIYTQWLRGFQSEWATLAIVLILVRNILLKLLITHNEFGDWAPWFHVSFKVWWLDWRELNAKWSLNCKLLTHSIASQWRNDTSNLSDYGPYSQNHNAANTLEGRQCSKGIT